VRLGNGNSATFTECRRTMFRRLRKAADLTEESYLSSMCSQPFLGGKTEASGKSGSLFLRSHDNKFVLKTIERHEFEVLEDILASYVLYLEEATSSLLCRFLGAYSLKVGGVTLRFVVMNNMISVRDTYEIYDLKGTTEDRLVDPKAHSVLKDNNFAPHTMLFQRPKRENLVASLQDDSDFLKSLGLMDYSLLVGISRSLEVPETNFIMRGWLGMQGNGKGDAEPETCTFEFGIIDYLQRWTPKKVAAHWLKKPTIGCCHEIDTEPPTVYSKRFYKYLHDKICVAAPSSVAVPSSGGY